MAGAYYRRLTELLKNAGFIKLPKRGKGSHEIWVKGQASVTVPYSLDSRFVGNAYSVDCYLR